ncbi:MAG: GNAT family N-acetyltransferase [Planctomycetota bacterium]
MTTATPRPSDANEEAGEPSRQPALPTLPAGVTVRVVGPGDAMRGRALGMLLTGRDAARDPRVAAFEDYARRAGLDTAGLAAALSGHGTSGERPIAAAVAMESPGSTAMLLVSPMRGGASGDGRVAAASACVEATVSQLPHGLGMAQCLLDLDQLAEAAALSAAGLSKLATLVYLQTDLPGGKHRAQRGTLPGVTMRGVDGGGGPTAVTLRCWDESPETRDLFGRAILDSYRDTRDCPGLVGTRSIEDILAGHRGSTGTHAFDATLWNVALCEGPSGPEPVGVLLLARLPEQEAIELVYLGVSDTARGRGLGRSLLRRGLAQSLRTGAGQMLLAVDENNAPAIALYRSVGFGPQQRRAAWVRFLQAGK